MMRMSVNKSVAVFLIIIVILTPLSFAESDDDNTNFEQIEINGQATLSLTGDLLPDSQVNATWNLEIVIPEEYGTDLLPNQSIGIRSQIDNHIGNSDGNITESEISDFTELLTNARSWTNSEVAGCCMFDYSQLTLLSPVTVFVYPPSVGPVISTSPGTWGWSESAELMANTDLRMTRLLDLPRTGSLIEEVPLVISIQEPWEFRFSAMQEIISGEPGSFTVLRAESPVYSTIRIAIGENFPPSVTVSRSGGMSISAPLDGMIYFISECEDSILETPTFIWRLSNNGTILNSSVGEYDSYGRAVIPVNPAHNGYLSGDILSAELTCVDSFGTFSPWYESIIIDGQNPSYDITFTEITSEGIEVQRNESEHSMIIRSDSELFVDVITSDNSNLPVSVHVVSNKSQGWRHFSNDELYFSAVFNQGDQVNGMHLPVDERHLEKANSHWQLLLNVTDEAGNTVKRTWDIIVEDSAGPVIIPHITANSTRVSPSEPAREGDNILLTLTESFDDLDSILNTLWTITINGDQKYTNVSWTEAEKIELSNLGVGIHSMEILATDSLRNSADISFQFSIEPKGGFNLEIIQTEISGDQIIGNTINFRASINNHQSSVGSARACYAETCSAYVMIPAATSSSSGYFELDLDVQPLETGPLDIRIEWIGNEDRESGTLNLNQSIMVSEQNDEVSDYQVQAFFAVLSVLAILIFLANRLWGKESMRP